MDTLSGEEPPPRSSDLPGWQQAIADERIHRFPLEALVAAIQDLGPRGDATVRNALAEYLSDSVYRLLDRNVGRNHPNGGRDIVDRVHFQVFEAVAQPKSADGRGLRQAFVSRVLFRLKDAIAKEARERRVPDERAAQTQAKAQEPDPIDAEADREDELSESGPRPEVARYGEPPDDPEAPPSKVQRDPTLLDSVRDADQTIDVNRFLEANIADDRKRLAFHLYMDGLPFKSKKYPSIAKALDVDEKTSRLWIEEIQDQLKEKIGDLT